MTIFFTLINLLLIAFLSRMEWKRSASNDSRVYWSALALRLTVGIILGLFYVVYYDSKGDTFAFFDDAVALSHGQTETVTTEPRSLFFVYIIRIVNFVTYNNYWLTSLWLSWFSFICSYRLVAKLDAIIPEFGSATRIALLFLPSVVFWSSGVIKESVAFSAVAMLCVFFLSLIRNERFTALRALGVAVFLFILFSLKYYWAAVLVPCMITAVIIQKIGPKKYVVPIFLLVFVLLAFLASFTHPNFYISRFLQVMVENHDIYIVRSQPDKLIHYYNLTPDWWSVIINSPWALLSGLFRPMVFEVSNVPGYLAAIENLLLLGLVLWKLKFIRKPKVENHVIVLTAVVYVVVLCIFLALSTPNFGTLSRFRIGFLPFFVLLILADHPVLRTKS